MKILGVTWNKQFEKITTDFKSCLKAAEYNMKRMLLSSIYSIYNTLGLASPVFIITNLLYSKIKQWKAWIKSIGRMIPYTLLRCVIVIEHKGIFLHGTWFFTCK